MSHFPIGKVQNWEADKWFQKLALEGGQDPLRMIHSFTMDHRGVWIHGGCQLLCAVQVKACIAGGMAILRPVQKLIWACNSCPLLYISPAENRSRTSSFVLVKAKWTITVCTNYLMMLYPDLYQLRHFISWSSGISEFRIFSTSICIHLNSTFHKISLSLLSSVLVT